MNLRREVFEVVKSGARVLVIRDRDQELAVKAAAMGLRAAGFGELVSEGTVRNDAGRPAVVDNAPSYSAADENAGTFVGMAASAANSDLFSWRNPKTRRDYAANAVILTNYLTVAGDNPLQFVIIKDAALLQAKRADPLVLVFVEPSWFQVPPMLAATIPVISAPLPTLEELIKEMDGFLATNPKVRPEDPQIAYKAAANVCGVSAPEAIELWSRCVVRNKGLDPAWLANAKAERVSTSFGGAVSFVNPASADIGGLSLLKGWLNKRRGAFGSKEARSFGLPEPKGLLLVGIPGCGKSLAPKTVARNWGLPLMRLDVGRLFGSLVGQSEAQTDAAIEAAEACSPCILWLDELEKGISTKGGLDGGTSTRVFGKLLTWLQEKTSPVFVIATANDVSQLPPELLRKGRFDEIFFVDLPTATERRDILRIHLAKRGRDGLDVRAMIEASEGFSGAELEQAVIDGLYTAYADSRDLTERDVLDAISGTYPLSRTMGTNVEALREWARTKARAASEPETARRDSAQANGRSRPIDL